MYKIVLEGSLKIRGLVVSFVLVFTIFLIGAHLRMASPTVSQTVTVDLAIDSFSSVLSEDDGIQVRVGRVSHELSAIEFRILQLVDGRRNWVEILPWSKWPLGRVKVLPEKSTAFQVDYRLIGGHDIFSKWMGDYYLIAKEEKYVRITLLRQINAQLRERDGIEKNIEKSAMVLKSMIPELLSRRASSRLIEVSPNEGVFLNTGIQKRNVDDFFIQSGAVNLGYGDRLLVLLAKLVFDSYQYGLIADGYFLSINQPVLNCNTFSLLLLKYLKYFGYPGSFVEIISEGRGHAVVEVAIGANKRVVDLTTGTVYLGGIKEISSDSFPYKIQIGQVRVDLDLSQMLRNANILNWHDSIDLRRLQANF